MKGRAHIIEIETLHEACLFAGAIQCLAVAHSYRVCGEILRD